MTRVVVLGCGYAGLACLIELSKKDKNRELHLLDADADHRQSLLLRPVREVCAQLIFAHAIV